MRTIRAFNKTRGVGMELYFPSRKDMLGLKVGAQAPTCFGGQAEVVEISCRSEDVLGRAYVHYYFRLRPGSDSQCSMSIKQDTVVCSVCTSDAFNAQELRSVEQHAAAASPAQLKETFYV